MKTVRYGDKGPFVAYLQLALQRAGENAGAVDGIFGTRTLDALTAFQEKNGLAADGIAGQNTWAALYPYLAGYFVRVVRPGDTFFRLAERYGTTVAAIETANPDALIENLAVGSELVIPLPFPVVPENVPYSYALVSIVTDGLAARYPFLSRETIGSSVLGKRIGTVSIGTGEQEVFYNASHHANEWIATPMLLQFLETYAAAYAADGLVFGTPARELYAKTKLYLCPLVNPDGVDLVTGALDLQSDAYRQAQSLAAYYPTIPFPSGWKANIEGVDLNLGYPANWEQARAIKFAQGYTRPGPRDFVGTAPLTAPENLAVYEFTRRHAFLLTISYHTQGEVIFYKYLDFSPPRAEEIGRAFQQASGYLLEETPYESGFAGYKDWFIQEYNRPGYTVEAGRGVNPLPLAQFPAIFRDNFGILALGMALV